MRHIEEDIYKEKKYCDVNVCMKEAKYFDIIRSWWGGERCCSSVYMCDEHAMRVEEREREKKREQRKKWKETWRKKRERQGGVTTVWVGW